jgi:FkbM family methyltransferase
MSSELPFAAKFQFIRHGLWVRTRPAGSYSLSLSEGEIALSYANNETDRNVVWDVFVNCCYGRDFRGATVVDVGAHKGYFGAYALMQGANAVVSFEPERTNFEFLERAATTFRSKGHEWETRRAAVTSSGGEVVLRIDRESWAHSIAALTPSIAAPPLDTQVVPATAMSEAVADAARPSAGNRLIAKIDAEGAECDIVLQTSLGVWEGVDEVFLEFHDFASCSSTAIVEHLGRAGHELVGEHFGVLHLRRSAAAARGT